MEADLSRYHQTDLLDRYRRGPDGRRLLTLRQILVRVRHLPGDSATRTAERGGKPDWPIQTELLDLLRRTLLAVHGDKNPAPHAVSPFATGLTPEAVEEMREAGRLARERRAQQTQRG